MRGSGKCPQSACTKRVHDLWDGVVTTQDSPVQPGANLWRLQRAGSSEATHHLPHDNATVHALLHGAQCRSTIPHAASRYHRTCHASGAAPPTGEWGSPIPGTCPTTGPNARAQPPSQTQGCIGRGGGTPPAPLEGTQPMPSHCPPDAKCQLQWHL